MNTGFETLRWLLALAVLAPSTLSQAQFEWMATHDGGQGNLADYCRGAAVDAAGNVFLATEVRLSPSLNDTNIDVTKYSRTGALLWTRRFDVPASSIDQANAIASAPNGDVCVVGAGGAPDYDLFLLRYDTGGNLLWSLAFGGAPGAGADGGRALRFDASGNIVVAGWATDASGQTDMLVKTFTPAGAPVWDTRIGGPQHGFDGALDLWIDAAGAIFVAGVADQTGDRESAVAKLDAQGQLQWLRRLNASYPASKPDQFTRIASDGQGGVIAVGYADFETTFPVQTYTNGLAARVDGSGNVLWSKTYGGFQLTLGVDAIVDDHGVASVLYVNDFLGTPRTVVQRVSGGGQELSTSPYDGLTHHGAWPGSFLRGAAGQIFITGNEGSAFGSPTDQAFLMQQDFSGATNWVRRFPASNLGPVIRSALLAPGNRIVLVGATVPSNFDFDALLMQIDVSEAPQSYCTAKLNSLGCTPRVGFTGVSSAAASTGFALVVDRVRNNKSGLFLYGVNGTATTPFGGGILCVATPVRRTPASNSGGTAPPVDDCSGVLSIDMNAFAGGALGGSPIAALRVPGTAVYTQLWGRDPGFAPPDNITLSDALRYVVLP